jgi:hypothetical protein
MTARRDIDEVRATGKEVEGCREETSEAGGAGASVTLSVRKGSTRGGADEAAAAHVSCR